MELSRCSILQKAILPCRECGASCSRYVTVEPDRPKTTSDYDTIGWSLPRRNDNAHIDYENGWCVEFEAPRESLQSNHDCGRYEARSQVFREHECPAGSCEFFQNPIQFLCRPPAEFEAYLETKGIERRWKRGPKVPCAESNLAE